MKGFVLGVLTTLLVLAAGMYAYLWLGYAEVRGDVPASGLENYLMSTAIHASVRRNAPEQHSPVPPTEVNLITGGKMYLSQCAGCHGAPGKPRGNPGDLNPAPQFPGVGTEYTESQIFWIALHGIRRTGMLSSGLRNSDEELWAIAAYIKRMHQLPPRVVEELSKPAKSSDN